MASKLCEKSGTTIGVLGGGQLGRMMGVAAVPFGIDVVALDPSGPNCAAAICVKKVVEGSFRDKDTVLNFAKECDVVTVEIEHVSIEALEEIEASGKPVRPSSKTLKIIRDKYEQKQTLKGSGVPVGDFMAVEATESSILEAAAGLGGFPLMLKARREAYDGRGNAVVKNQAGIAEALSFLGNGKIELYAEKWVPYNAELSVIVARNHLGETVAYDPVETRQENNLRIVVAPPSFELDESVKLEAQRVAMQAIDAIEGYGIFAIEQFWVGTDKILVNEIAPRPHNSGHFSIEANVTSQFEQHIRSVVGLPLGDVSMRVGAAAMINILGAETEQETTEMMRPALTVPGAKIHWYGKTPNRLGRKHGHITVTAPDMTELRKRLVLLGEPLDSADKEASASGYQSPKVGVIMGSDSDLPHMEACGKILDAFNVPYELTIVSAHRTPDRMFEYAKSAVRRGLKVIIAAAGGAAHLPGMVAALTPLPVIGVPIKTSTLNGQDSLLSIVQMPRGVPVATVAIGNSTNGALLAIRMLATGDSSLLKQLESYHEKASNQVLEKASYLEDVKYEKYLSEGGVKNYRPYITSQLKHMLKDTTLSLPADYKKYVGKVRDCYFGDKKSILIATDRLSGFDRNLGHVPFKGAVLNLISQWWFEKTKSIIPNHVIAVPHDNVCVGKKCAPFAIEFVVRGYLTGSTSTSIWTAYKNGKRSYCGHTLAEGMIKNQKLPEIICTPTTKSEIHDMPISGTEIVEQEIMTKDDWLYCESKALELFKFGQEEASKKGLLLVDTKYEFGRDLATGEILLIDEIHTPDSSRYWMADTYDERMKQGKVPDHFDKEFVRLWFRARCDPYKDDELPTPPDSLFVELSRRYVQMYETIIGKKFQFKHAKTDVNSEIVASLQNV
eukprot:CAMPEP_0184015914 /NCGR_PEP_ID=MMETSP0954-20121128/6621_1 /TAXON_ID=627963 /ORGANISM="Aplanochytrium sp, Strain PBS07" /LENGTH=896 /DNA_ID=CAMNT_0026296843 /DNA_START=24 /DNA_END=2715 /DNA_ORIENTATION=+